MTLSILPLRFFTGALKIVLTPSGSCCHDWAMLDRR